nr:PLP-dependent aminotransferase family protein [Pacificimonas pallii]
MGRPIEPLTQRPVLAPGVPATDLFPRESWARAIARGGRLASGRKVEDDPLGWKPLRLAIADHIGPSRGVVCDPDQIMIVDGARCAIELILKLLTDPGDRAWLEDPGYTEARQAILHNGVKVVPVPCDREGLMVAQGERMAPSARLAYVTPAHQYPSGIVMSAKRRLDLLAWADRNAAWIIEDDYDGEFRHRGTLTATLASIDRSHRVIHLGTFSKSMFPALRLAYLVLPPKLVDPAAALRFALSGHTGVTAQRGLAEFIISGQFAAHVRAMRQAYGQRQQALLTALDLHFSDTILIGPDDTGLHMTGKFAAHITEAKIADALKRSGVGAKPLSAYFADPNYGVPGLVLGYAGWSEKALSEGVRKLASALAN